jgi:hypothetical protein
MTLKKMDADDKLFRLLSDDHSFIIYFFNQVPKKTKNDPDKGCMIVTRNIAQPFYANTRRRHDT